jgi:hypothetical protein
MRGGTGGVGRLFHGRSEVPVLGTEVFDAKRLVIDNTSSLESNFDTPAATRTLRFEDAETSVDGSAGRRSGGAIDHTKPSRLNIGAMDVKLKLPNMPDEWMEVR